jgi:hypothetical protein
LGQKRNIYFITFNWPLHSFQKQRVKTSLGL